MAPRTTKSKIYKRPPVIEAVIEVRFANPLKPQQLEKLAFRQKSRFTVQPIQEVKLKISFDDKSGLKSETENIPVGYKLINKLDTSNIIHIKSDAISLSRLPPYEGWINLISEFKKYYLWYTKNDFKKLSRIGVRYINRIDIPRFEGIIKLEDYIKIYPKTPKINFPDFGQFSAQTTSALGGNRMLIVNVRSAEDSPLLDHGSVIFDIDVVQSVNLPENNDKLLATLDEIRDQKNFYFESLLTVKCKRLFN
jgi:uncharacterized protein (TIGR04255 family)